MKGTPQGVVGAVEKFEWTYTEVFSMSDKTRYDDGSGGYGYSVGEENELPLTTYLHLQYFHIFVCLGGSLYNGYSAQQCCEDCRIEYPETKFISYREKHWSKCYCFETVTSTCYGRDAGIGCYANKFVSGSCGYEASASGRKKREIKHEEEAANKSLSWQRREVRMNTFANSVIRQKRDVEDLVVRQITCEPLWDGTAGYWSYQYTVPEYCFSNV